MDCPWGIVSLPPPSLGIVAEAFEDGVNLEEGAGPGLVHHRDCLPVPFSPLAHRMPLMARMGFTPKDNGRLYSKHVSCSGSVAEHISSPMD